MFCLHSLWKHPHLIQVWMFLATLTHFCWPSFPVLDTLASYFLWTGVKGRPLMSVGLVLFLAQVRGRSVSPLGMVDWKSASLAHIKEHKWLEITQWAVELDTFQHVYSCDLEKIHGLLIKDYHWFSWIHSLRLMDGLEMYPLHYPLRVIGAVSRNVPGNVWNAKVPTWRFSVDAPSNNPLQIRVFKFILIKIE